MNPRRLKLRNLRSFVELDLELPDGRVAIVGENGAGKSTLATAIDWALIGPDGRSFAAYLTQGSAETEMLLELTFEHAGREYRVRRTYSSRGSGKATLDLHVLDETVLEMHPLTRETVKQTQEFIETILGLTRETFRASSMLVQGDGAAFTEAQPRDRKQILARILGLERWDVYLAACRRDIREREQAIELIGRQLGDVEEEIAQRADVEAAAKENEAILSDAERLGKEAGDAFAAAEALIREATQNDAARALALAVLTQMKQELQPLEAKLVAAQEAVGQHTIALEERDTLMTDRQIAAAEEQLTVALEHRSNFATTKLAAHHQNRDRADRLVEIDRLETEIRVSEDRIDLLLLQAGQIRNPEGDVEACPHCGQPLTSPAARQHAADATEAEAAELRARTLMLREEKEKIKVPPAVTIDADLEAGLDRDVAAATAEAQKARAEAGRRAALDERIRALAVTITNVPGEETLRRAEDAVQDAQDRLGALPPTADSDALEAVREAATEAERRRDAERVRWQAASTELARLQERLRRIVEASEKADAQIAERDQARVDLDELKVLEQAYGRDGIPAWIVSQVALPSIQTEATRILSELGTSYRVELRTERATATGDLVDALDVIVTTEDGERPYETFSGGERTRINLALRIALARLLANRRRGESRLLVIDEPEFLDGAGTDALIQVLRGLVDFSRIWLISHVPNLRDAALDGTIEVTRDDAGWSSAAVS